MPEPNISLTVQPPQIQSPVDQVSKGIALRDMISQNQLRQQQIQQSQAETETLQAQAQQRQRDLADQQTLQQSLLSHKDDGAAMWDNVLSDVRGRVTPEFQLKAETNRQTLKENVLKANKADLDNHYEMVSKVDNALSGLKRFEDPDQQSQEYSNVLSRFGSDKDLGPTVQGMIASGALPKHYDPKAIDQIHAEVVGRKGLMDEARAEQGIKTSQQSQKTSAAQESLDTAKLPGARADSDISIIKAKLLQDGSDPTKAASVISAFAKPGSEYYNGLLTAYTKAPTAEAKQAVLESSLRLLGERDPDVIAGKVKEAVLRDTATMPLKVKGVVDTEIAKATQAPGFFNDIIDPFTRNKAIDLYSKATTAYHDEASKVQTLIGMIDAAQYGNKSAPGLIPVATLRQFITRPNVQELRGVGNAGSWLDKAEGFLRGATEGEPIPADVLQGLRGVAILQKDVASHKYDLDLATVKSLGGNPYRVELSDDVETKTDPKYPGKAFQRRKGSTEPWVEAR